MTIARNAEEQLREVQRLVDTGDPAAAERLLLRMREECPDSPQVAMMLAGLYCEFRKPEAALPLLNEVLVRDGGFVPALQRKATALYQLNRPAEAVRIAASLTVAEPTNAEHFNNLGVYHMAAGDFDAATDAFATAVGLDGDYVAAYHNLLDIPGVELDQRQVDRLESLSRSEGLPARDRALALFSLSRHFRACGEIATEFEYLDSAKEILAGMRPWNPTEFVGLVDEIRMLTPDALKVAGQPRSVAVNPIFICSMPRAGSTLLEQLLAAHPEIGSIGEAGLATLASQAVVTAHHAASPHWWHWLKRDDAADLFGSARVAFDGAVAACRPATRLVSEKAINNDVMLGLCLLAYPHAFAIHCRRDPLDVCLSAYQAYFPHGVEFNNRLDWLALRYQQHVALMNHWKSLFPGRVREIHYEDLVEHPENEIGWLLDAMGIAQPAGGLDLRARNYAVKSASNWQVRQPIYKSSRQRWRRYEKHLSPIMHLRAGAETDI